MSRIKSLYNFAQTWQEHGNIKIISDTHFNDSDRNLMGYNITEQEQCKKILEGIRSNDTIIHLGDVGDPTWMNWLKRRRTHLYTVLIKGNHDVGSAKYKPYFDEIYEGPVLIAPKILLSHEPIAGLEWCWNIHGHDHSDWTKESYPDARMINLANNVVDFKTFDLSSWANSGALSKVDSIHRITIDNATERKNAASF